MLDESDDNRVSGVESAAAEADDIAALKLALTEEKTKAETNLTGWQRAQADFINYKRRTEQEKEEISQFAKATLILELLSVLDDLERAYAAMPPRLADNSWVEGIKLIWNKLRTTLEAQGVSEIEAVGEAFDPHLHEAVRQERGREGIIMEEVQKGYKFRDRIIRPSKVVVGNGEEESEKED